MAKTAQDATEAVSNALESYAQRGVFRGFSKTAAKNGKATYRMMWHRDRFFDLVFDLRRATLRIPVVLPEVPAQSAMYREFKTYVLSKQVETLPDHRRIDSNKVSVKYRNSGGEIALTFGVIDGDFEYAARKLIHLVHEIYLDFLMDGPYYDYMVEHLGLDPDAV
jgi:hypothetical protein